MNDEKRGLRYPVLLVHGMGFRDRKHLNYWGRIPRRLEEMGCRVYYGHQDSNGSIEDNAETLRRRIIEITDETGCEKLNVIAHSKGGLDIRYAVSRLGMADRVVSVTTINTPHNGSKTVDFLLKAPEFLVRFGSKIWDLFLRMLGDENPSTYRVVRSFTTKAAESFNRDNPDAEGVYYRSYAFVMKRPTSDMIMWFPALVVWRIEGQNDGFLPPDAVKYGDFRGVYGGAGNRGISHCDEVDLRRRRLTKKTGDGISDITDFYAELITELRDMGF